MRLEEKAAALLALHHGDTPLVLPNVWDPASAAVVAEAGAQAIATSSAGVAWTLGRPDGERVSRDEMVAAVARIAASVDVPVSADLEAGYGNVAETVRAAIAAGAVGANFEDSARPRELVPIDEQAARLGAGREAARAEDVPSFVVNARTDVFLRAIGDPTGRVDEVKARARAYADAGADCLFVPGLLDLDVLSELADASPIPLAVLARPGGPTVAELTGAGVRRISVGPGLSEAAYGLVRRAAHELLEHGTYGALADAIPFAELQELFP